MPDLASSLRHALRRRDAPREPRGPDPARRCGSSAKRPSWPARTRGAREACSGAHGISTPTTSYFEHNERWKGDRILDALRSGRDVALVSDAGTPGISDPGYRLVRDARRRGSRWCPCPARAPRSPRCRCRAARPTASCSWASCRRDAGDRRRALEELAGGASHPGVLRVAGPDPERPRRHDRPARGPRGLPLPRGHEAARGVPPRTALDLARDTRLARVRPGRDRAGRGREKRGGAPGRPGSDRPLPHARRRRADAPRGGQGGGAHTRPARPRDLPAGAGGGGAAPPRRRQT